MGLNSNNIRMPLQKKSQVISRKQIMDTGLKEVVSKIEPKRIKSPDLSQNQRDQFFGVINMNQGRRL